MDKRNSYIKNWWDKLDDKHKGKVIPFFAISIITLLAIILLSFISKLNPSYENIVALIMIFCAIFFMYFIYSLATVKNVFLKFLSAISLLLIIIFVFNPNKITEYKEIFFPNPQKKQTTSQNDSTNVVNDTINEEDNYVVEVIYPFEQEGIIWSDSINGLYTDKRDDQKYKVLKIGEQIWFAQNLNYYTNNGSWIYDWNKSNATKYGRLYDWNTAVNSCPEGWRIPTDADWKRIEKLYGLPPHELDDMQRFRGEYNSVANSFLKNGISGLNIVFGGHYDKSYKKSKFIDKEAKGPYWTSSSIGNKGVYRNFWNGSSGIWRNTENKMKGFSCRCIKDVNNK